MNPYSVLWISKWASNAEIKKAYRKQAMKWHPDKNKWNKEAEKKFKEINNAYDILKDPKKKQQYDTFWDVWWAWASWFSWWNYWWTWWFEDMFSNFSKSQSWWAWFSWWAWWFDFSDFFTGWAWMWWWPQNNSYKKTHTQEKEPDLDVTEVVEVPIFDLILGTKINVKTVYNDNLTIKIKPGFKPWKKLRVKWKWRISNGKTWDLYIKVEAKMPDNLPDDIKRLLEDIKYRV